ncbi:MAG: 50S ribosomal protein L13 [bacterium]|nr:50S ribosomal protein L13 [bacterium]
MTKTKHIIDATDRTIGRVASEAAALLIGKNSVEFARNIAPKVEVQIINCSKAKIPVKKLEDKVYVTFTGFRGGLYNATLGEVITKKGYGEVIRRAVDGMLPKNKLRKIMIMNLKVAE